MSIARKIAFGVVAGWVSRFVSVLMGLMMYPLLFRHLSLEEIGVWLLLGQSWAVLGILDLGFGATLMRRIAFETGKTIGAAGGLPSPEALKGMADLVCTGRIVFRIVAVVASAVAFAVGCFSLQHLHLSSVALPKIYLAWGILCFSQCISVMSTIWTCLLQGTGFVGWDVMVASFVSLFTLTAQIAVVIAGGGLVGLATAAASGSITQRLLVVALTRRKRPELFNIQGAWQPALLKDMVPVSLKAWVTSVSQVVVMNTDNFFIAGMKGAREIPSYKAAYSVFINLMMLSITFAASSGVFIAQLWKANELARIHRLVIHNLRLGLSFMVTGGACVLGLGQHLFNLWIGRGNYVGPQIPWVFFTLLVLETQSTIIATSSRATEDEAFAVCAVLAAIVNVILSFILGARYGLFGIALATLIAQGTTSHWFMCYRGLRRLRMSLRAHLKEVVVPIFLLFIATLASVRGVVSSMAAKPDWAIDAAAALVSGVLLCCSIWLLVFDRSQRKTAVAMPARLLRSALG